MEVADVVKDAKDISSYEFENRLAQLANSNRRFKNLDRNNRHVLAGIFKKYKYYIDKGSGISKATISREIYKLYQGRKKNGLTEEDLKDFREILGHFNFRPDKKKWFSLSDWI